MTSQTAILYQDDALVVAAKPSGLAVHRGWAAHEPTYAVDVVTALIGQRVHPAHRLDRATSGVLVFALDPAAAAALGAQFAAHSVAKVYLALVRGVPPEAAVIDHPIANEPGEPGKDAVTAIRRLATIGRYSLVEARPASGRRHQIRRHLKHIACPLIGDVNYGKGEHNRLWRAEHGLHRLALHAIRLDLDHPRTGARMTFRAPVPDDLAGPLLHAGFAPELLEPERY
ncbi:MAG: pseudouridine synthase [Myxococcota bacterium]